MPWFDLKKEKKDFFPFPGQGILEACLWPNECGCARCVKFPFTVTMTYVTLALLSASGQEA